MSSNPSPGGRRPTAYSATLPPTPRSAGVARQFMRERIGNRLDDDRRMTVELLTSEVVTNVVLHARTPCRLELARLGDGAVRVAVTDQGGGEPAAERAEPTAIRGRGLALVDALATRWGVVPAEPAGKTVWFEVGD
jgi:anti-sigma regulatory factor (Ser/Thr protein kinase)